MNKTLLAILPSCLLAFQACSLSKPEATAPYAGFVTPAPWEFKGASDDGVVHVTGTWLGVHRNEETEIIAVREALDNAREQAVKMGYANPRLIEVDRFWDDSRGVLKIRYKIRNF